MGASFECSKLSLPEELWEVSFVCLVIQLVSLKFKINVYIILNRVFVTRTLVPQSLPKIPIVLSLILKVLYSFSNNKKVLLTVLSIIQKVPIALPIVLQIV